MEGLQDFETAEDTGRESPSAFKSVDALVMHSHPGAVKGDNGKFYDRKVKPGNEIEVPDHYFCGHCHNETGKGYVKGVPLSVEPEPLVVSEHDEGCFGNAGDIVTQRTDYCRRCNTELSQTEYSSFGSSQ